MAFQIASISVPLTIGHSSRVIVNVTHLTQTRMVFSIALICAHLISISPNQARVDVVSQMMILTAMASQIVMTGVLASTTRFTVACQLLSGLCVSQLQEDNTGFAGVPEAMVAHQEEKPCLTLERLPSWAQGHCSKIALVLVVRFAT
jgi:hypothetical protein